MVIWKKNLHVIESQHLHSAALHACTPVICSNFYHLNLRRALNKERHGMFVLQMRAASSVMITVLTEADCNLMLQVTDINLQKCLLNEGDFLK